MDYLFQDGGKPKKTKSKTKTTKSKTSTKTGTKTTKSKTSTKTGTKTTKSKTSTKKGGNFLGSVGELVAPTGWGPFATAAGLLALDRADAALRRGKSEKSSAKKGGMRGGYTMEKLKEIQTNFESKNSNDLSVYIIENYNNFLKLYQEYLSSQNKETNGGKIQLLDKMIFVLESIRGYIQGMNVQPERNFQKIFSHIGNITIFLQKKKDEISIKNESKYKQFNPPY
jgi:hypothetical protein